MTDQLLLDVDAATELHQAMSGVADQLDRDRTAIRDRLATVETLVGPATADPDAPLCSLAETLRSEADDLARRLRMVIFGGPEINAGLLALDRVAVNFDLIDNRGNPDGNDGVISRSDLEWAVDHLDANTAAAAQWLLDHDDVFASVDTARGNDNYLAAGGSHFSADDDSGDGKFSLDDVNSYVTKLDTWATLLPYMATIDVAAKGGDHDGVMSEGDFEAFLNDYDLPPDVRQAAQQVIDDHAFHDTGNGLVSWGTLIDVASFIPVVGDVLDGAMALYYLSQGRWADAAMSGIGLIPIPGVSGGSVRAAVEGVEVASTAAPGMGRRWLRDEAVEETAETGPQRAGRQQDDLRELGSPGNPSPPASSGAHGPEPVLRREGTEDWATYVPQRDLPRNADGPAYPVPDVKDAPHTQLSGLGRPKFGGDYPKARQWEFHPQTGELLPTREMHFTGHSPKRPHPNPHQHVLIPNNPGSAAAGAVRGKAEPLEAGWLAYD